MEGSDHLAELTQQELERLGYAVDRVASAAEAEAAFGSAAYDLILLEMSLPDGQGLPVIRRLRRKGASTPVLILTARESVEERVAGLDAGADDCLVKPFDFRELAARCRALLRRPAAALSARLKLGDLELDIASRTAWVRDVPLALGPRETALLESLLRRGGEVVPREVLRDSIYSGESEITGNALDAVVCRLRRHLSQARADAALKTLPGVGYRLCPPAGARGGEWDWVSP